MDMVVGRVAGCGECGNCGGRVMFMSNSFQCFHACVYVFVISCAIFALILPLRVLITQWWVEMIWNFKKYLIIIDWLSQKWIVLIQVAKKMIITSEEKKDSPPTLIRMKCLFPRDHVLVSWIHYGLCVNSNNI